jgi:hypothetical protein
VFTIAAFDEQSLKGCFAFTAVDQQSTVYKLSNGLMNAQKNELAQ